jgi:hypothetical protein
MSIEFILRNWNNIIYGGAAVGLAGAILNNSNKKGVANGWNPHTRTQTSLMRRGRSNCVRDDLVNLGVFDSRGLKNCQWE